MQNVNAFPILLVSSLQSLVSTMAVTIKSEKEVELLREGGKLHAAILRKLVAAVKPGVSTAFLDEMARSLIEAEGDRPSFLGYTPYGADRPYPASSNISVNEEVVHGIPNENPKILKEGDIVSVDVGLNHKGVFTDAAITVAVGKVDEAAVRLMKATEEAMYAGITAAKGGNRIGDIGYAIEKVAKEYGYALAEDLCGHGVGRAVHEDPYVPNYGRRGNGPELSPGMVLAIEPMLNEGTGKVVLMKDGYTYRTADKKRSAHFEHTILITEDASEILTK